MGCTSCDTEQSGQYGGIEMDIQEIMKRCESCQYKPCKGIYFNGELVCLNSDLRTTAMELPEIRSVHKETT